MDRSQSGEADRLPISIYRNQDEGLAAIRRANRRPMETVMPEDNAENALVRVWVYPKSGGDGKIVELKPGARPPQGFVFSPADQEEPKAETEDE